MEHWNKLRETCGKIANNEYFLRLIMFVILVNSVFLTMQKPDDSLQPFWMTVTENTISSVFIFEMVIKMLHLGPAKYFSEKWNCLDFIVVSEAILSMSAVSSVNISFLRVFRVLRPLRTINRLKSLRLVVNSVFDSMLGMGYILAMLGTFIFLCAMIANLLWADILHNQCVSETTGLFLKEEVNTCKLMGELDVEPVTICDVAGFSDGGRVCPTGYECAEASSTAGFGFMNFDSIRNSLLVMFQLCTNDSWNVVMWLVQDAFSPWVAVFFIFITIAGNCAILNLFIASIMTGFQKSMTSDATAQPNGTSHEDISMLSLPSNGSLNDIQNKDAETRDAEEKEDEKPKVENIFVRIWEVVKADVKDEHYGYFPSLIAICIFFNLIIICMDSHLQSMEMIAFLAFSNLILNIIFIIEVVIKLIIYRSGYFERWSNILDFILAALSLLEGLSANFVSSLRLVRLIRLARLLRMSKLGNRSAAVRQVFRMFVMSVKETWPVLVLIALVLYIGAIAGLNILGAFENSHEKIRFDTFYFSVINVFQVICGEDWTYIMYWTMGFSSPFFALFFLIIVFLGQFLLLNLVIAIILDHSAAQIKNKDQSKSMETIRRNLMKIYLLRMRPVIKQWKEVYNIHQPRRFSIEGIVESLHTFQSRRVSSSNFPIIADSNSPVIADNNSPVIVDSSTLVVAEHNDIEFNTVELVKRDEETPRTKLKHALPQISNQVTPEKLRVGQYVMIRGEESKCCKICCCNRAVFDLVKAKVVEIFEEDCMIVVSTSKVKSITIPIDRVQQLLTDENSDSVMRSWILSHALSIVNSDITGNIYIAVTFLSVLSLFMEEYRTMAIVLDVVCLIVFVFISTSSIIAANGWGNGKLIAMDAILTGLMTIEVILIYNVDIKFFKLISVIRSVRTIRILFYFSSLRIMMLAIGDSVKKVATLVFVLSFCWLIYAAAGQQLFKGLFYSCSGVPYPDGYPRGGYDFFVNGTLTNDSCEARGGAWESAPLNYDNIGQSLISVFLMMSLDGWSESLYQAMDAYEIDYQPSNNHSKWTFVYYFWGVIIFGFYFRQLFIAVLFEIYFQKQHIHNLREKKEHVSNRSDTELLQYLDNIHPLAEFENCGDLGLADMEELIGIKIATISKTASKRTNLYNEMTRIARRVIRLNIFRNFILGTIVFCMTLLIMESLYAARRETPSESFVEIDNGLNYIIDVIFLVEMLVNITALGIELYLANPSHVFECAVSVAGAMEMLLLLRGDCSSTEPSVLHFVRSLRIFLLFKLLMLIKGMRSYMNSIAMPLRKLMSVLSIVIAVIVSYAVVGHTFFNFTNIMTPFTRNANFQTLLASVELLIVLASGESWSTVMYTCMDQVTLGIPSLSTRTIMKLLVAIYFISFIILANFVMLSLFVMIICDTYQMVDSNDFSKSEESIGRLQLAWRLFDPNATGIITKQQLKVLLLIIPPSFGVGVRTTAHDLNAKYFWYNPTNANLVFFPDVLFRAHMHMFILPKQVCRLTDSDSTTQQQIAALLMIQRYAMRYIARKGKSAPKKSHHHHHHDHDKQEKKRATSKFFPTAKL